MSVSAAETVIQPFVAFRFEVVLTIDNPPPGVTNPVCEGAFSECSGLEMSMEPWTKVQGGSHNRQIHRIDKASYGRLTLRRGMTKNAHLWNWFAAVAQPGRKLSASGEVRMLNADGSEAVSFALDDCLPVRVSGPSLNGENGQIAIEELQLVYAFLRLKGLDSGGGGFGLSGGASFSASASLSVSGGPGLAASVNGRASASLDIL
jgi:phage tail-like protein